MAVVLHIVVGSLNPVKVEPVRAVLARAFPGAIIAPFDAESGVPAQPLGAEQIRQGAHNRARHSLEHLAASVPDATASLWGVGLESGVIFEDRTPWLTGAAAIAARDGRASLAWSLRLALPPAVAEAVRAGRELGPLLDELSGIADSKTKQGAVGYLTKNLAPRGLFWEVAFACALAPFLHPNLYTNG